MKKLKKAVNSSKSNCRLSKLMKLKKNIFERFNSIFKDVKLRILNILDKFGLNFFFSYLNKKQLLILIYHGISEKDFNYNHRRYYSKSLFEKELKYLKKRRYQFISLTEWLKLIKINKIIKNKYVILTFDDGFKNVIDNAYPIMKKYNAKGCYYVISGLIGKDELIWSDYIEILLKNYKDLNFQFTFKGQNYNYTLDNPRKVQICISDIKNKLRTLPNNDRLSHLEQFNPKNNILNFKEIPKDYLMADWNELKTIDKNILEIGGHSKSHPNLASLKNEEEFIEELYESKNEIEEKLDCSIDHICYPVGSYNANTIEYAKKYGYLTGVTTKEGFNTPKTDLFQLKRLNIKNNFLLFKYKISGLSLLGKLFFEPIKKIIRKI